MANKLVTESIRNFNKRFQDAVMSNNKQLSQSLYISLNSYVTVRNHNMCFIGPHGDFRNLLKTNIAHANMNLLMTDASGIWQRQLDSALTENGYTITVCRDVAQFNSMILHSQKQAVFLQVHDEQQLKQLYENWISHVQEQEGAFLTPLLFIPSVPLPNIAGCIYAFRKLNIHFVLYGNDIDNIRAMYPHSNDDIVFSCDTIIITNIADQATEDFINRMATERQEILSVSPNPTGEKIKYIYPYGHTKKPQRVSIQLKPKQCIVFVAAYPPVIDKKL